jgi:hypothetical protein
VLQSFLPTLFGIASLAALSGCGSKDSKTVEAPPPDPCPQVSLEKLSGDWVKVKQDQGDPTNRFRISGTFPNYQAVLTPGDFGRYVLKGTVRKEKEDVVFDEVLDEAGLKAYTEGKRWKVRLTVEPNKKKCSLRCGIATVTTQNGKDVEKRRPPGAEEFVPFPKDLSFTFDPCTGSLFLGPAAKTKKVADAQLKDNNGLPDPSFTHAQAVPVGVFTPIEADGDPSCTYDMDLYFDDRPAKDRNGAENMNGLVAGKTDAGFRQWLVPDWYAPYSGPHHFQMYRYRTCADGKRTNIGVQCLLAVLE